MDLHASSKFNDRQSGGNRVEEHVTLGDVSEYAELLSISERFKTKGQPPMEPGIPVQGGSF